MIDSRFDGRIREGAALLPTLHPGDSHAVTLVETAAGDLLCAWFNGPGEGEPDTNIVLSRLPAGTDTWLEPVQLSSDPHRSEQNPLLFVPPPPAARGVEARSRADGPSGAGVGADAPGGAGAGVVWLLHTSNEPHDQSTSRVIRRVSRDGGLTWGRSEVLFDQLGSFIRNPIVVLSNGDWLLPAYDCDKSAERTVLELSTDRGETWSTVEVPEAVGQVQMSVVELSPGELVGYFRSRAADRIHRSVSKDNGRTWTAPEKTALPNNNSAIQVLRLSDGRLVMVFNDSSAERDQFRWVDDGKGGVRRKTLRTPLTLALSEDDGATWPYWRNLQVQDAEYRDNEFGYSYPTLLQTRDGRLHVAYSYLRKTIKHVILAPEWIQAGDRLP
ncbi:sialidase family protein [Kribbella aluminosa]|uniref:sialidase family protein n=1 Tax=Kribbella aluminosa TaxID=416017 RepID=UPI001AEAFB33|nr:sialidase family protein [Kribbella aluminosa]